MGILMRIKRAFFRGHVELTEKQNKILNIVFFTTVIGSFITLIGAILYLVCAFFAATNGSDAYSWVLQVFSDFTYITDVSLLESPYVPLLDEGSSYPPLAIAILFPFGLICKGVYNLYDTTGIDTYTFNSKVVLHPEFWVAFMLFFFICSTAVIITVIKKYKLPPMASLKTAIVILLCSPFIFAIMRGNTIYFAFIFIMLFLMLYEHKNPFIRELGYLCLVIAGLIKIYPLFFGVYLLHKKKIFASIRIAIYTFVLFFLSFFIYNGLSDIPLFINNLGGFAGDGTRLLKANNLSISGLLFKAISLFTDITPDNQVYSIVNLGILALTFLVTTVAAVYTKSNFTRATLAAGILALVPSISYFYILIFTFIPFMEFLRDFESMGKTRRTLYSVFFIFLFLTPTIIAQNYVIHSLIIATMLVTECVRVFKNEMFKKRTKKEAPELINV